jgi:hypothetical protein
MAKDLAAMRDRQFTLRSLMVTVVLFGALFAWIKAQDSPTYALVIVAHSRVAWGICLCATAVFSRVFGPNIRSRPGRVSVWTLLGMALCADLYFIWAQWRAWPGFPDTETIRGFPFPDYAIIALARWFDVRNPAPPGTLKMHGELPRVAFIFGLVVVFFTSVFGFLLGVLLKRPADPRLTKEKTRTK